MRIDAISDVSTGEAWPADENVSLEVDGNGNNDEVILDKDGARLYRAVAARLNYIAPDWPDIAFAVKEAARSMSSPCEGDMRRLRMIGLYLPGNTQAGLEI